MNETRDNLMIKSSFYCCLLFFILIFVSCSPLDKDYNPRNLKDDLTDIEEMGIPQSDLILLEGYLETQKMNNLTIDTTLSYEELLEKARTEKITLEVEWYKNHLTKTILEKKNQQTLDSLNSFFSLTLLDKYVDTDAYRDYINVILNIENKSKIEIKGLRGTMNFYDLFGDLIKKSELKCDDPIPPKQSIQFTSRIVFNALLETDIVLMEKDKTKFYLVFKPTTILLANGQTISL